MSNRRFLVLHGWQNRRPREHWQWQLVETLREDGEQALYPQLPNPNRPSLREWSEVLEAELGQLGSGERVVVAHSLSVLLWVHAAAVLGGAARVDRVLLVAPPSPAVLAEHDEVREFAGIQLDAAALRDAAVQTRLVCSDNDPYCPGGASATYAGLGLACDVLPGAGHLDPDAGYGAWPSVAAWCRDPRTRLAVC